MAGAKLFKEADLAYEDTHPDLPGKIARIMLQSLTGGLGLWDNYLRGCDL